MGTGWDTAASGDARQQFVVGDDFVEGRVVTDVVKRDIGKLDTLAGEINAEHRAFIVSLKKTAEHGIRAGELLAEAKAQCKHGEWLPWLRMNFEGSERSAQVYMQMYRNRDEIRAKYAESADLSISGALKEISAPREEDLPEDDESPCMSRKSLEECTKRINEAFAKIKEAERQSKEAEEQIRKAIDGLVAKGRVKEARVELRERAFFELGLAWGRYNMDVVGARSELKDYLDVLAVGGSSGAVAIRDRVEERLYKLEPLESEERGLLKQFYPEELERVDARAPQVLFFADIVERLNRLVCPADIYVPYKPDGEAQKRDGVKTVRLTDEQVNTPITHLLETGTLEEKDVYRFERWPHPLLWIGWPSEEDEEPEDWEPSAWWLQKARELRLAPSKDKT